MQKRWGEKKGCCGNEGRQRAWICEENKQCCFCWLGFFCCNLCFSASEQQSVSMLNKQTERMKLTVDSCLAQRWTFLLCDNEDDEQTSVLWKPPPSPDFSRTQEACFSPRSPTPTWGSRGRSQTGKRYQMGGPQALSPLCPRTCVRKPPFH